MKNIQISPSILSADFSQLGTEIKRLEEGGADMIHVDVMDGHFVPNLTIGPPVIKALRKHCSLKFDVHLMISPVHKYIEAYADAGADIITVHPEATDNLEDSINKIKDLKKKVGVSLNPETSIDLIKNFLDKMLNFIIPSAEADELDTQAVDFIGLKSGKLPEFNEDMARGYEGYTEALTKEGAVPRFSAVRKIGLGE